MKLTILAITILGFIHGNGTLYPTPGSTELLAGSDQKNWYVYSKTPDDALQSCKATNPQSLDNSWVFFTNGTFEFNNGTITQDINCKEDGCCSDMLNTVGKWAFTNNESGLKITMLYQKDKPSNSFNEVLFDAPLLQLTADKFVIKVTNDQDEEVIVEFRVKI